MLCGGGGEEDRRGLGVYKVEVGWSGVWGVGCGVSGEGNGLSGL